MASNRELREGIESLSLDLGLSLPDGLQGMNNPRLVETLEALQARKAGGSPPPAAGAGQETLPLASDPLPDANGPAPGVTPAPPSQSVAPPPVGAVPVAPAALVGKLHHVAEGKSVTTLKGQLGAFQRIKAHDLPRGSEELEQLVNAGFVTRSDRLRG